MPKDVWNVVFQGLIEVARIDLLLSEKYKRGAPQGCSNCNAKHSGASSIYSFHVFPPLFYRKGQMNHFVFFLTVVGNL